jgi:hypothetical protein
MGIEIPTLIVVMIGAASAVLVAIALLASPEHTPVSRPFRRDPMDWHPGQFFPPTLARRRIG